EKYTIAGRNTFGRPVSISLLGKNLTELSSARDFLIEGMKKIPLLNNISDNNALGKREIRLELKPKAYFLGLNQASISNQVRQGFFGGQAQRLQKGKDELRVWVRYPKTDRLNLGQLESMTIKTPRGEFPLAELATYKIERGPVNIQRFNGSREIRVFADLVDPLEPVPPILENIKQNILPQLQAKYPGVRIEYQGQRRDSDEATGEMMSYFQIAFFLIILVITIHFRSFTQALIILLMIPLGWIGSTWGHGIENLPVSMLSAWGMVALTGVIINDAVIFLQKYNTNLLENMTVKEAVYNAGLARFRPIILTTLTTTIGLYPIILEKSFQAQFLKPMAVALAYGILFGTAFILLFFPAIILVLNDLKVKAVWVFTGKHVSHESVETAVKNSKKRID
ncbi:MAG: efflux RND transporter permease subunit, partial [Bacteroidales bacterium]|nr:efflux RND transporter permease subunit [Bacteroidales bacterium]